MPFQSEAQRRYLWANEPEIARDWTDTYGSKIQAADGGIMRLGFKRGSSRGGFEETQAAGRSYEAAKADPRPGGGGDAWQQQAMQQFAQLPASATTVSKPEQQPNFLSNLGTGIKNYVTSGGLTGMALQGLGKFFKGSGWDSSMGPRKDMGYNPNRINPFHKPDGGGDGQQQYPPWWYDNAYAQNIVGDEELDIDTSTGNMEDWVQRFRVKDPYRQDQGALDEQIREYISKLYT